MHDLDFGAYWVPLKMTIQSLYYSRIKDCAPKSANLWKSFQRVSLWTERTLERRSGDSTAPLARRSKGGAEEVKS